MADLTYVTDEHLVDRVGQQGGSDLSVCGENQATRRQPAGRTTALVQRPSLSL